MRRSILVFFLLVLFTSGITVVAEIPIAKTPEPSAPTPYPRVQSESFSKTVGGINHFTLE